MTKINKAHDKDTDNQNAFINKSNVGLAKYHSKITGTQNFYMI